jgi:ribonuclease D
MATSKLISRGGDIAALVEHLRGFAEIAVDAEMDSYFSYRTKLCLIQISSPERDFLVDPLADVDLTPLQEVFASPHITKILHAGDNDVPYLIQRVGGRVWPIFDTHYAAKVLALPKASLGGLLQEFLGLEVDKAYQRADWRQRPLPEDMIEYAYGDTRHLLQLAAILRQQLSEGGMIGEAEAACLRIPQSQPQDRQFNPHAYLQNPQARSLSKVAQARLRDLYRWRDDLARRRDSAVFRVLPDGLMVPLALFEGDESKFLSQFRHPTLRSSSTELLQLLREAPHRPQESIPEPAPVARLRGADLRRFEKLRQWRNDYAQSLGIEPERVFTNRILKLLVEHRPHQLEHLAQLEGLEAWRLEKFGAALWEVLKSL